ncbi:unnamed protein product [Absidia cylindrospora]
MCPYFKWEIYLSATFIQQQTIQYIKENKGRTTVTRLADMLNIDISTLMPYLTPLALEQDWTIIDDHLLARSYLSDFKQDCLDRMNDHGFISLVAQTSSSGLPYRLIQEVLHVSTIPSGVNFAEISDLLFTQTYVDQQKQRILEYLHSTSEPLSMQKLQKCMELQEDVFYLFLEQIIKDQVLQGTFRGRRERSLFIPHMYRDAQLAMIDSLLKAGNYIQYYNVEQLYGFATPKELLLKLDPNIILLDSCAVTESLVSLFEYTLLSPDITWLNASDHLPSVLSSTDITTLLEMILLRLNKKKRSARNSPSNNENSNSNNNDTFVLLDMFVTTERYLGIIVDNAQSFLNQRATAEISQQKFLHSSKGSKKRKDSQTTLTNEEIQQHLVEQQGLDSEFAAHVTLKIKRSMKDGLEHAMQQIYITPTTRITDNTRIDQDNRNTVSWLDLRKDHFLSLLGDLRQKLYYNMKAVSLIEDASSRKSMEKYMVRQLCGNFMFYLVLLITLWQSRDASELTTLTGLRRSDIEHPDQVDESQKKQVIAALVSSDTKYQDDLAPLYKALQTGKKMDEFTTFISKQNSTTPLIKELNWIDLNNQVTQRQYNETFRTQLSQQLEATTVTATTAPSILHLTTLLCFQALHWVPLNVSGKYVPTILKHLAPRLASIGPNDGGDDNDNGYNMLATKGNDILKQLGDAETMIMAGWKPSTDSSSSTDGIMDLEAIHSVRQLGLDLCQTTPSLSFDSPTTST